MSDLDPQTKLHRMALGFPDHEALADYVSVEMRTIRKILEGAFEVPAGSHLETKINRSFAQIQKEHRVGADAVSMAIQTIDRVREGSFTDDQLENAYKALQRKADKINTAYA